MRYAHSPDALRRSARREMFTVGRTFLSGRRNGRTRMSVLRLAELIGFLLWKDLVERHFPLPQPETHDGDAALVINAHDLAVLVVLRHPDRVVRLQSRTPLAQLIRLTLLTFEFRDAVRIFLALLLCVELRFERFGAGLLRFFAFLLQLHQLRSATLPAAQVLVRPLQQIARQLQ